jgi:polyhydroxyalkanoate synthesis regulator phasin
LRPESRTGSAPDLSELTGRVARLEESLKALGETASAGGSVADAAALDAKLGELEQKLQTRIDAKLSEGETSDRQALDAMKSEIADLNAKLGALSVAERGADQEAASAQSAASVLALANFALPSTQAASLRDGASKAPFARARHRYLRRTASLCEQGIDAR